MLYKFRTRTPEQHPACMPRPREPTTTRSAHRGLAAPSSTVHGSPSIGHHRILETGIGVLGPAAALILQGQRRPSGRHCVPAVPGHELRRGTRPFAWPGQSPTERAVAAHGAVETHGNVPITAMSRCLIAGVDHRTTKALDALDSGALHQLQPGPPEVDASGR